MTARLSTKASTRNELWRSLLGGFVLSLALIENAWAYLDPATGWMILQGLIAAIAAAFVAVGTYWSRLKGWFFRSKSRGMEKNEADITGRDPD